MPDLSRLSNEELMRIAGVAPQSSPDVSAMSDDELMRIAGVPPSNASKASKPVGGGYLDAATPDYLKPQRDDAGREVANPHGSFPIGNIADMAAPFVAEVEQQKQSIARPLNPGRPNTPEDSLRADEYSRLDPVTKLATILQRGALGAIGGGVGMVTQGPDMLVNPQKYGKGEGEAIDETAAGLTDMVVNVPDQLAYLSNKAGFAPGIGEALGLVGRGLNLGRTAAGMSDEEQQQSAVSTLYDQPESLAFGLGLGKGAVKGVGKMMPKTPSVAAESGGVSGLPTPSLRERLGALDRRVQEASGEKWQSGEVAPPVEGWLAENGRVVNEPLPPMEGTAGKALGEVPTKQIPLTQYKMNPLKRGVEEQMPREAAVEPWERIEKGDDVFYRMPDGTVKNNYDMTKADREAYADYLRQRAKDERSERIEREFGGLSDGAKKFWGSPEQYFERTHGYLDPAIRNTIRDWHRRGIEIPREIAAEYPQFMPELPPKPLRQYDMNPLRRGGEKPVAPPAVEAAKQPWEYTKNEFGAGVENDWPIAVPSKGMIAEGPARQYFHDTTPVGTPHVFRTPEAAQKWVDKAHKQAVKQALRDGKPVPASVLADYPDLAPTQPEGVAPKRLRGGGGKKYHNSPEVGSAEEVIGRITKVKLGKYKTLDGLIRGRDAYNRMRGQKASKEMPLSVLGEPVQMAMSETPFVQRAAFDEAIIARASSDILSGKHVPDAVLDEFPQLRELLDKGKRSKDSLAGFVAEKKVEAEKIKRATQPSPLRGKTAKGQSGEAGKEAVFSKDELPAPMDATPQMIADRKSAGERWDSAKLGYRVELAQRAKYITKKGGLSRLGEKLAETSWDKMSDAAKDVFVREIKKDYPSRFPLPPTTLGGRTDTPLMKLAKPGSGEITGKRGATRSEGAGKKAILDWMESERDGIFKSKASFAAAKAFVESMPDYLLERVSVGAEDKLPGGKILASYGESEASGDFSPVTRLIRISRSVAESNPGGVVETLVHEFGHNMELFIPKREYKLLRGQYYDEALTARRNNYAFANMSEWWANTLEALNVQSMARDAGKGKLGGDLSFGRGLPTPVRNAISIVLGRFIDFAIGAWRYLKRLGREDHARQVRDMLMSAKQLPDLNTSLRMRISGDANRKTEPLRSPRRESPTTLGFMGANPDVLKSVGRSIEQIVTSVGDKAVPEFLKQARNRGRDPRFKQIIDDVGVVDERWHRRAGQAVEQLRKNGLEKLNDKEAIELADKMEAGTAPEYSKVLNTLFFKGKALGLRFNYRKNYFPRIWKTDVLEKVMDDVTAVIGELRGGGRSDQAVAAILKNKSTLTQEIVKHLIDSGQAKSYSAAVRMLEKETARELFPESSFERKRTLDLPANIYERNAKKVLPAYVDVITKRMAIAERWGKDGLQLEKRLADLGIVAPEEAATASKIVDMWSGAYERNNGLKGTARKVVDAYMGFETATKIGLGTATIPNLSQTVISTMFDLGGMNTLEGGLSLLTKEGRTFARESGILRESMIQAFAGKEPKGIMGKAAKATMKWLGFHAINKFNISLAATSAKAALESWHKTAQGTGARAEWAKKRLADFGLKPETELTENVLLEKSYRFATDSQLQRNILKDPLAFNDPKLRPFFLFKRFGYRQATLTKDILWREIRRGNTMPLLRLAVGGYIGGEFVVWAKNMVREQLTGQPQYRKEDDLTWRRFVNNLSAVGSAGMISDLMDIEKLSDAWGAAKFAVAPVFVSDIEKIGKAYQEVTQDYEKYGDVGLTLRRNAHHLTDFLGSLPRYVGERTKTESQKEGSRDYYRGRERTAILDLMIKGDGADAKRRLRLWNENNPKNKIDLSDVSLKAVKKRIEDKRTMKEKAEGTYKPKPRGSGGRGSGGRGGGGRGDNGRG